MTPVRVALSTTVLACALAGPAGPAVGAEPDVMPPLMEPLPEQRDQTGAAYAPPLGGSAAGDAMRRWEAGRSWRYDSDYLFPLTRGLGEAGVPWWARPAIWALTVPLDTVQLPFGALAGLFGD